jgi:hypothetical protein
MELIITKEQADNWANKNTPVKIWKDLLHGFSAQCKSKNTAWMLIRNKCHELNLEVPTFDNIIEA